MDAPTTIRLLTDRGDMDLEFSHIISTPLGNFAVFAAPEAVEDEDAPMAVLKLVEPTDEELEMALDFWAEMGRDMGGDGFPIWVGEDEE